MCHNGSFWVVLAPLEQGIIYKNNGNSNSGTSALLSTTTRLLVWLFVVSIQLNNTVCTIVGHIIFQKIFVKRRASNSSPEKTYLWEKKRVKERKDVVVKQRQGRISRISSLYENLYYIRITDVSLREYQ